MAEPAGNPPPQAYERAFEVFGVRVGISTNDERVRPRLASMDLPGARPCDPTDVQQHFTVTTGQFDTITVRFDTRDGETADVRDPVSYVASNVDIEFGLGLLDSHVHAAIGLAAPEHVFVEAGVVARDGMALVLPGKALTGKTTLVTALVRAGCEYYSARFAVLDEQGRVHPYATRLDHPDAVVGTEPLPIAGVVETSYMPAAEWQPRRLSHGEGILSLMSHAVPAQHRYGQVMRVIRRSLESDPVMLAGERGDAEAVAPLLLAELEQRLSKSA